MPAFPQGDFITIGSGLNVAAFYPVDYRFVFANASDRLALSWYAAYDGLITYQQDTQEIFVLINKGTESAPTVSQNSSWRLVGGGSGSNYAAEWAFTNTLNQSFAFTGDGLPSPEDDPTLYLLRGQSYRFSNNNTLGTHPFQIQTDVSTVVNGGTPYNLGVTNNRASGSQQLIFNVPMSAPDTLYYQCTTHPAMSGSLIIVGNPGSGSADNAMVTASIAGNDLTFTKGNGDTFTIVLPSGSSGSGSGFPFSGSAVITGSLEVTGSITASAGVVNQLTSSYAITSSYALEALVEITKEVSSSYADSASLAESASFIPFDGNRVVTNQDQPTGIKNVNFGANGLADFIEKVYFANTAPSITTTEFRNVAEFTPSGSLIGTINTSDAEGQTVTVQTQSSYTADQFRIEGTNQLYLNVEATESMNTDSSQGYDAAPLPIRATDTLGLFTEDTIYIEITPNSPPTFRNGSTGGSVIIGQTDTTNINESSANGVKRTIYYADADGDTVTINTGSLSAKFKTDFQININTVAQRIQIEQINNVDFDTYPTYSFVLTASDEHYPTQDPEAVRFLTCSINVVDNTPPNMANQSIAGVNENINVNNFQGGSAGNYVNAGQVLAYGPEVGDTLTFTNATLVGLSVDGVNVPLGTYYADGDPGSPSQSNPNENAFEMSSTGYFTRRAGVFINSDLIDSYVYSCSVQDNYDPTVVSASVEIPIADDVAPSIDDNWSGGPYINESALSGDSVVTNTNGVGGTQAQFSTTYSVTNETVSWQLNPASPFALDSSQRISANADISASYFSPSTIAFSVTASNTFGTENKQAYSVTVTDNQAPTFNISNVATETDDTTAGSNVINVTNIQDIEQNLNYTVSLSGTHAALFNITTPTITTNGGSTFLTAVSDIAAGTYSINVTVTDSYGSSRTTAHSITITQSAAYGPMYIYATDYGTSAYNTTMGYSNNPNNPGDATLSTNPYPIPELVSYGIDQDAGLDSITLTLLSSTIQQYATAIQPDATNPSVGSALEAKDSGTISGVSGGPFRWIILIPSGSSITQIPIDGMVNGIDGGNDPDKSSLYYYSGGLWNSIDSRINKVDFGTDSTKNKGYRYWYVIGSTSLITTGGSLQIRIVPENGTAPS